jgi:succinyl-CoA synthetase alpha subunit/GNAT superfamily N-acetyltransferase
VPATLTGYPTELEADAVLADGGLVHLRAIRPDDGPALVEFHSGLSTETVYRRFFSVHPRLSADEVGRFTNLDYKERLALVGTSRGLLVGVGRYDRLPGSADAEVAFVVADEHQGRGLGTLLLEHLALAARQRGISRFVADTLSSNREMRAVFAAAGFSEEASFDQGVVRIVFPIETTDRLVKSVARREAVAEHESLSVILAPRSIVVVDREDGDGPGSELVRQIEDAGFTGTMRALGPDAVRRPSAAGVRAPVDMVVANVPPELLLDTFDAASSWGARAALVVSDGPRDGEPGPLSGVSRRVRRAAWSAGIRLIGPSSLGVANTDPRVGLSALRSPGAGTVLARGGIGLFAQSAAASEAALEAAESFKAGLSSFVSSGDAADVSGNDLLCYWESDPATRVIALALDSIGNPRRFWRIARRVARSKPVVVLWRGAHDADRAVRLFAQAGVIAVADLAEMFATTCLLAGQPDDPDRRSPGAADRAAQRGSWYREWLSRPEGVVPTISGVNRADVLATIAELVQLPARDAWLRGRRAEHVLRSYGIADSEGLDDAATLGGRVVVAQDPTFGPLATIMDGRTEGLEALAPLTDAEADAVVAEALQLLGIARAAGSSGLSDMLLRTARLLDEQPDISEVSFEVALGPDGAAALVSGTAAVRLEESAPFPPSLQRKLD